MHEYQNRMIVSCSMTITVFRFNHLSFLERINVSVCDIYSVLFIYSVPVLWWHKVHWGPSGELRLCPNHLPQKSHQKLHPVETCPGKSLQTSHCRREVSCFDIFVGSANSSVVRAPGSSSTPGRSGEGIFVSRVSFLCWLIYLSIPHPCYCSST